MLREFAAQRVKPLLSDDAWQRLRRLHPLTAERDRLMAEKNLLRDRRLAAVRQELEAAKQEREAADLSGWSLTALAEHFGTDKWGRHRYTPHYERHLGHLKHDRFTLVELGIGGYAREKAGGASLRMWKAFFPQAQIVGVDIEDKTFVNADRIRAYRGSQVDEQLLHRVVDESTNLQVVIDDGSHRSEHVIETFRVIFPLLPLGGVYVIEDTQTSYWRRFGGSTQPGAPTSMNFVKDLLDGMNYEEFTPTAYEPTYAQKHVVGLHAYHNLIFIEKGVNAEGSRNRPKA